MTIEERRVMIIPIGLELDRALVGIPEYKPDLIYVIYSRKEEEKPADKVEIESKKFKDVFVNKLRGLWNYKEYGIEVTNLSKCTQFLKDIIDREIKLNSNTSFYINISTSSKIFSLASFYLAGKYSEKISLFYVKATQYLMVSFVEYFKKFVATIKEGQKITHNQMKDAERLLEVYGQKGWTNGPFELIEIPYYRISKYPQYEIKLLEIMNLRKVDYPNGFTIEDLLELKNEDVHNRVNKIKLNYHLTDLEKKRLIENRLRSRKKHVKIEKSGEIFLETIASLIED